MDTEELETLDLLHFSPVDINGGLFGPPFPIVHDQPFVLLTLREVVLLAPHYLVSDHIDCLIVVRNHCCVVRNLNDGVGVVLGHATVVEPGVQNGTNHAPLRGPSVEDQRGRCCFFSPIPW